jgi:hypothetical protein
MLFMKEARHRGSAMSEKMHAIRNRSSMFHKRLASTPIKFKTVLERNGASMFGNWFGKGQKTNNRQSCAAVHRMAGPPSSWPTTYAALAELSYEHLQTLMFAQNCVWKHDDAQTWHVDMTVGTITWQFQDKVVRATGQLLGSWYNGRFLWGWAHPSAPPGTAVAAMAVKGYADRHGIAELQAAQPDVSFEDSWKLVAIAALIGDLQGVYRGPSGSHGTWAYIGFGPISIANDVGNLGPIRRNTAPPGLDFSSVDSRGKADALVQKGELAMIYLFPLQLGGVDFPVNQVFVPPHVVALKDRSDSMVAALLDDGKVSSYTASPKYKDNSSSIVPCSLLLKAKGNDDYSTEELIEIW